MLCSDNNVRIVFYVSDKSYSQEWIQLNIQSEDKNSHQCQDWIDLVQF